MIQIQFHYSKFSICILFNDFILWLLSKWFYKYFNVLLNRNREKLESYHSFSIKSHLKYGKMMQLQWNICENIQLDYIPLYEFLILSPTVLTV